MATTIIKPVKVKRMVYSKLIEPMPIKDYMDSCILTGSNALLYKNPKITTAFFAVVGVITNNTKRK